MSDKSNSKLTSSKPTNEPDPTQTPITIDDLEKKNKIESSLTQTVTNKIQQMKQRKLTFTAQFEKDAQEGTITKNESDLLIHNLQYSFDQEVELLNRSALDNKMNFLKDIIRIENLFNSHFTKELKEEQRAMRKKYCEPDINRDCRKPKPASPFNKISELNNAMSLYKKPYEDFIEKISKKLKESGIKVLHPPKASVKDNIRIFYKTYYIYNGHVTQMADCLRSSFVFESFKDVYQSFKVIKDMAEEEKCENGILRVKDRFNEPNVPFGYRDLLLNVYCPKTKFVSEIQLHHNTFYQIKDASHKIYKLVRLFEDNDLNSIYELAKTDVRPMVKNELYVLEEKSDEKDHEINIANATFDTLLKKWHLQQFIPKFESDGWTEINTWDDLLSSDYEHLKAMEMKTGHIKAFERSYIAFKRSDEQNDDTDNLLFKNLLEEWKLSAFRDKFEQDGWIDVDTWDIVLEDECAILKSMGMKAGHIAIFKKKYAEYKTKKA